MAKNNNTNSNEMKNTGNMDMDSAQSQNKTDNKKNSAGNNKAKGGAQNSK